MKSTKDFLFQICLLTLIMVFTLPIKSVGQARVLSGTVLFSEDNDPIIGVNVLVKGTNHGTVTDLDGHFSLSVADANPVIVFSMVGMKTLEVKVGTQSVLQVIMESDAQLLEQVVVTGYTTQKKADLTGSVAVVDVKEIMKQPENNPIKALQGRVTGMEVFADGNPSGAATIRIRGVGTLNNNDPLFVIDGVPTRGGMHELNSNDIETIQVLKDASASSIYGSRAGNGVIIITTKKGREEKLRLNFDSYITHTSYANKLSVMNAKEYGQALWQATINNSEDPNLNNIGYSYNWNYDENGNAVLHNILLPKYIDHGNTMLTSDTKWFDEISQSGLMQSYNLSASHGTKKGNYFLSLGYLDNQGTLKHTSFDRISLRINSSFNLIDNILTIGENFTVNKTSETQIPDNGIIDLALKALPIIPVHTADGKGWGGPTTGMNDRHNPARLLYDNKDNNYDYLRLFGNMYLNLQLFKDFNFKSNFGIDLTNFFKRNMIHSYTSGTLSSDLNSVTLFENFANKWTWSNTINYVKKIETHDFDALVGIEMYKENTIGFSAYKDGFLVETPEQMWPDMAVGKASVTGSSTGYSLLSYFGKINYSYNNRYLASFTLRHDGSSRFGENNRFATFPAFSLGYRISEEEFMINTKNWLSDLKIRFAWGQTGNQETSNNATHTIFVTDYGIADPTWRSVNGTSYNINGINAGTLPSGYKKIQTGNPDLKWETTTQTNLGLDFGLFEQKLYGSIEYYVKNTKDILVQPPYLGIIGEGGYKWYNGASMNNTGGGVSIGYRNKSNSDFSYDILVNISGYRNKITELPEDVINTYGGNGRDHTILGRPIHSFYGYVADGLFKTEDEISEHAFQSGAGLGRIRYQDLNDDDKIDEDDRTWIGSPHPDFTSGLNINLAYKNFDISTFFYSVYNIDLNVYPVKSETDFWSINDVRSNKGTRLLNAWSLNNMNSDIPAISALDLNNESRMSTYFIENGSFVKLRNLQIGYNIAKNICSKFNAEKCRFYVSGQNLFTIKDKSFTGVDPENASFGYPIPLSFTIGLNIEF